MSLVTLANTLIFLGLESDPDDIVQTILNGVDAMVKNETSRDFESTTYTEFHSGDGSEELVLKQFPIISVSRLATERISVIKIKNTASDATTASATVDSDSLDLVVSGGSSDGSSSLAFATYTTMSALVTAINALGNGWSAEISDSDYNSFKSTNIFKQHLTCTSWAGTTATWNYIECAGEPALNFIPDLDTGVIYYTPGFPVGTKNIIVTYTAGYSSVPSNLQEAVYEIIKLIYQQRDQDAIGVSEYSLGHLRVKFDGKYPVRAFDTIEYYVDLSRGI